MGMEVKTPGELGRIAGVILGETGERESRPCFGGRGEATNTTP